MVTKFKVIETGIEELFVIEPQVFEDNRGYFFESYNYMGLNLNDKKPIFVQDNQSKSRKGVLRGLHFQKKYQQDKLIRVLSGEIFDVAVDLRNALKTYRKWFGINISGSNKKQLYIPKGFAHGYYVLSDEAEMIYKCSDYYHHEDEGGIIWNDTEIAIQWPIKNIDEIIMSEKDMKWKSLIETPIVL